MSQHSAEDPDSLSLLTAGSQALLIDFLNAHLDLAFTFVQTAAIEAGWDDAHARSALEEAEAALRTVRLFQGRIKSPDVWATIDERTTNIEATLSVFNSST